MNKLLARQIAKYFDNLDNIPPYLQELLKVISSTYDDFKADRDLIERSLDLSSRELVATIQELQKKSEKDRAIISRLRKLTFSLSEEEVSSAQGKAEDDAVSLINSIIELINARHTDGEKIRAQEEQFRTLVDNIPGIVYRCANDADWTMSYISNGIEDITGYPARDFIGNNVRSYASIIHEDDAERIRKAVDSGVLNKCQYDMEYRILTREGEVKWVYERGQGVFDGDSLKWLDGAIFDVSERKRMESELIRNQHIEALGVLAGGIAHDFNNLLTGVLSNINIVQLQVDSGSPMHEALAETARVCIQAKELTRQLLTFSKGGMPIKRKTTIQSLLKDTVEFILRGSNIKCEFFTPVELWGVEVDAGQISQAIQNIAINGKEAMTGGGVMHLNAENVIVENKNNRLAILPGKYIKVSITDSGCGIPKENLSKIFDPYFTTKPGGNGLGLAMTYSIITKHQGYIDIDSKPGVGTTFDIYLPAAEGRAAARGDTPVSVVKGHGRILVMDDEDTVRSSLAKILEIIGYTVVAVADGRQAIDAYREHQERKEAFDAVILDLTVHGAMGGCEVVKILREIDPGVRAVVSSGYSNDAIISEYKEYGFRGCIIKPYEVQELSRVLYDVIYAP